MGIDPMDPIQKKILGAKHVQMFNMFNTMVIQGVVDFIKSPLQR